MNLFQGMFDQTDQTGMTVRFLTPPLLKANARPALTLDFGHGTATWTTDATGKTVHTYTAPGIVTATLTDEDGVNQALRFEVPRGSI